MLGSPGSKFTNQQAIFGTLQNSFLDFHNFYSKPHISYFVP